MGKPATVSLCLRANRAHGAGGRFHRHGGTSRGMQASCIAAHQAHHDAARGLVIDGDIEVNLGGDGSQVVG